MFKTIEDISYERKDDEDLTRKQLEKEVLTKGAWATIVFKYQEIDQKTNDFGAEKAAIVRYRKRKGYYTQQKSDSGIGFIRIKRLNNLEEVEISLSELSEYFELTESRLLQIAQKVNLTRKENDN